MTFRPLVMLSALAISGCFDGASPPPAVPAPTSGAVSANTISNRGSCLCQSACALVGKSAPTPVGGVCPRFRDELLYDAIAGCGCRGAVAGSVVSPNH